MGYGQGYKKQNVSEAKSPPKKILRPPGCAEGHKHLYEGKVVFKMFN